MMSVQDVIEALCALRRLAGPDAAVYIDDADTSWAMRVVEVEAWMVPGGPAALIRGEGYADGLVYADSYPSKEIRELDP